MGNVRGLGLEGLTPAEQTSLRWTHQFFEHFSRMLADSSRNMQSVI